MKQLKIRFLLVIFIFAIGNGCTSGQITEEGEGTGSPSGESSEGAPEQTQAAKDSQTVNEPLEEDQKEDESKELSGAADTPPSGSDETIAELQKFDDTDGDGYLDLPVNEKGQTKELSLKEIVHLVLQNNNTVRLQQLEIIKSDTALKKEESKYSPTLYMSYEGMEKQDPEKYSTPFQGTQTNQDVYRAGVRKLFETGTSVQFEASDSRFDNNAGEVSNPLLLGSMGSFTSLIQQPPIHTGSLSLALSQELLKNSFGYSQERINQIAKNNASIQREELTYQLSQLVVSAMIDFWNLKIQEENVKTQEKLYTNIRNVRNITVRKTRIGLAESFEVNQWNAMLAQSESALDAAKLERDNQKRKFLRTLNLSPDEKVSGASRLLDEIPDDINLERDVAGAYQTRPDLKNLVLQKENVELQAQIAENNLLPSVTLSGSYASRDQGRHANSAFNAVPKGTYPQASVKFQVEYPLWDEGTEVDYRNAKVAVEQIRIQEKQLRRQIEDDLRAAYQEIQVSFRAMEKARYALGQNQVFYGRLLTRYRQGRFTAEAVKNALDALFQARLGLLRSQISFNIALVRYDMVRNNLWKKYDVDIDSVIDRLEERSFD